MCERLLTLPQDIDFLARSVCDIETRAAAKFGFPQPVDGEEHEKRLQGFSQVLDMFESALIAGKSEKSSAEPVAQADRPCD
jgi:hypothetical protein